MKDIAVTTKGNREYFCARGWYRQAKDNKWARITVDHVKIIWADRDYLYNYKEGNYVRCLTKEHWVKVRQNEVPLQVFNRLEAL